MKHPQILLAVALIAGACGGTAAPGTPDAGAAPALAYAAPPVPLTYEAADSMNLSMDAGPGGTVTVSVSAATTAELHYATEGADLLVTVQLTSLDGRTTSSMGPSMTVGNDQLPGPGVVRVTPQGEVTVVEEPEMSEVMRQVVGSQGLFRRYFVPLPGRAVARGASWTDTVRISEDNDGLITNMTSVVRSTWARDTVVGGRTLHLITSEIDNTLHVEGTTQGVQIVQRLTGPGTATTLWDPARSAVVSRMEEGQLSGSTDLPAMGISGMPVNMRTRQHLRLRGG